MKKSYGIFIVFIIVVLGCIGYGIFYVFGNVNAESYVFNKDGYALYATEANNYKTESYAFSNGSTYNYKKSNNKITFNSANNGNVSIDDSSVIHYTDNSLLVLKNVVGLDLNKITSNIILYYNIYKNTNINYNSNVYSVISTTGEDIKFEKLLIRINENKYLFLADNIRATVGKEEVIDYGKYVYIEYTNGSVVALYNNTKSTQSIANELSIVSGDIAIDLGNKSISKAGKKYITLSNLVINSDGNIDLIESEKPVINKPPNIENKPVDDSTSDNNVVVGGTTDNKYDDVEDDDGLGEIIEDENKIVYPPEYKITNMKVTAISLDAEIEIEDKDSLIITDTEITVVDNATLKKVYESIIPAGDTSAFISCGSLSPDTEYTIYAKSTYKMDSVEYSRSFINKIFRTEALGVVFEKSYATMNSITVKVKKRDYSEVTSAIITLYDSAGVKLEYKGVDFVDKKTAEVTFSNLTKNSTYKVVMDDILCNGVVVEKGYSEEQEMLTLKEPPTIGELQFEINKKTSKFDLSIDDVKDPDYGVVGYRYEIFGVRQNMDIEKPLLVLESDKLEKVSALVDENKIIRGQGYTYRVVVIFDDNDKIVEYIKELGRTMQMDGVSFPTVRFDPSEITWEQINGTIIVDDPNNTIAGDSYRVVYKNAVDVYTTDTIYSTSTEEVIPISVNDLRANETYTFQVYADVNLKDGNPTIYNAYIGSVIVKTGLPQALNVNYHANVNYSSAFSVDVQFVDPDGVDASLEASTISEMTLTLYQGSSTNGAVAVYRKVVDSNTNDYISSIKSAFYDTVSVVNPAFFNSSNNDYTEKAYTLVISDVYDYTKYKNEIPVTNNTFTFNVNSFLPDLPGEGDIPINVTKIVNRNGPAFGIPYDNNLDSNTIVGYNIISNYQNDAENAIKMVYHVWSYNQLTGEYEIVKDYTVDYDEAGNTESVVVPLGYGTSQSVFDGENLRRGNEYYFSYEVYLDIDGNGTSDVIYPNAVDPNAILKSETQYAEKQVPSYKLYPSVSSSNSATWKYVISDVDNCLDANNLYAFMENDTEAASYGAIIPNAATYNSVSFNSLTSDTFYSIKALERKVKSRQASYVVLSSQYLSSLISSLDLAYDIDIDSNTLAIRINDYANKKDIVNLIASVDVVISPTDSQSTVEDRTFSGLLLQNGVIFINLYDILEFLGTPFTVRVDAYFDSGNMGFDVSSEYVAMQSVTIDNTGVYFSIDKNNKLVQNSIIVGSELNVDFRPLDLFIQITNKKGNTFTSDLSITSRGVILDNNNVSLKELIKQPLSYTTNTARFDLLVPNISLIDDNNVLTIGSQLNKIEFTADLDMLEGTILQDNKIFIDLYQTDVNGTNAQFVRTYTTYLSDYSGTITLDNLSPKTNYFMNFYTYIYNASTSNYDMHYLYDVDQKKVGFNYSFHTLSDVGINNIESNFVIDAYNTKKIQLKYTLNVVSGYDHIEYELYEKVGNNYNLVDINIPDSTLFFENMTVNIDANPGNPQGITFGKTYKIILRPIGSYNLKGTLKEVELGTKEKVFTIGNYSEPYVGISSSKTSNSIFFRVSIDDTSRLIHNDVYTVKLLDSNDNVLKVINNNSTTTINKRFDFTESDCNLKQNETYKFVVSFDVDYTNDNQTFTNIVNTKQIKYGNAVRLGSISASLTKNTPYSLDIIFADSYLLSSINKITYTVSSATVSYFSTGTTSFNLSYSPDGNLYIYRMKIDESPNLKTGHMYTITMNFYTDDSLVEQAEISYYYGG